MRIGIILIAALLPLPLRGQQDTVVLPGMAGDDLPFLVAEAIEHNPEIRAAAAEMDVRAARPAQAGALPDPQLTFMSDEMPGFRFGEAMYDRIELMQEIPFPTKLAARRTLADIDAGHAHHDHLEIINAVIARLKSAYYSLWYIQQRQLLDGDNLRLMGQVVAAARARYGVGRASQPDVLKAEVEGAMLANERISRRQEELSAKALIAALLNRPPSDTIGFAVIPEEVVFSASLDSLLAYAMAARPMLVHDSMAVEEGAVMGSLARQERLLPDLRFGLQRVTSPSTGFEGWSVAAGITIPFAPWTLAGGNARVDEAEAVETKAREAFAGDRAQVAAAVRDLFYQADAARRQLAAFRSSILPQARQALEASLTAYQTGTLDILMLFDAYRTLTDRTNDYYMARLRLESAKASLERETGSPLSMHQ